MVQPIGRIEKRLRTVLAKYDDVRQTRSQECYRVPCPVVVDLAVRPPNDIVVEMYSREWIRVNSFYDDRPAKLLPDWKPPADVTRVRLLGTCMHTLSARVCVRTTEAQPSDGRRSETITTIMITTKYCLNNMIAADVD